MFAKVAILLVAVAAAQASVLYGGHAALVNTGVSTSARSQDAFGNYAFNYGIQDGLGATNSRSEVGDAHGNKKGSYTLADIDGRARRVDYVADGHGFRAVVKTNEPGTAASAPAAALVASPYAGPVAPVVNHVAPAAAVVGPRCNLCCSIFCFRPSCLWWSHRTRSRPCCPSSLRWNMIYNVTWAWQQVGLGEDIEMNKNIRAFGNYAFNYGIQDGLGAANSRAEVGDAHGNKKGSYTIADIDGRARRVDYVADGHGFRAVVKTNEPGTAASAPAAALVTSPYAGPVAPVVNHVAPAAAIVGHAATYTAPFAVAAPAVSAPVAYGGVIAHGAALAAPVAYGEVLGHGLGLGAPLGLGYGLGYGKALIH
ncbi:Adult-specific rigid cuticular protein 15.7 like protein [Argiope bruennichi]|uniref:Adult-specific rigid cuticular protein 15.7 like protein n=1 Tax=Argiope bruennichi TaxID=94029 RepID=A0A8T0FE81_ARGBR|nr:Adult-specific rigid cuticular protein 15.7 like protein [Argiope bruennichi]